MEKYINPTGQTKEQYKELVDLISLRDSPVGIDAQYTHAIIITYLQQITKRLENLEKSVRSMQEQHPL